MPYPQLSEFPSFTLLCMLSNSPFPGMSYRWCSCVFTYEKLALGFPHENSSDFVNKMKLLSDFKVHFFVILPYYMVVSFFNKQGEEKEI